MVWIRSPVVSASRMRNANVGAAANRSALPPTQSNTRSLIAYHLAPGAQPSEEGIDLVPGLRAAVEALPMQLDDAGQLVAGVDRHLVALETRRAPAQQQRLDIWRGVGQRRIVAQHLAPGVQWQQRFSRAGRAGIERDPPVKLRVEEDERHP